MAVIGCSISCQVLAVVFIYVVLKKYNWNPERLEHKEGSSRWSLFHPRVMKDSFMVVVRKRAGDLRLYIWTLIAITVVTFGPFFAEFDIAYNYVRTRYQWQVPEYSVYSTISSSVALIGQVIIIPIFAKLKIRNSVILMIIISSMITRNIIKALAAESWMYYLAAMVDMIGSYSFSVIRAMMASCVPKEDIGRIFAMSSSLDNAIPILITQLYAWIWQETGGIYPGTVFFVSAFIVSIGFLMALFIHLRTKGQTLAEIYDDLHPELKKNNETKTGEDGKKQDDVEKEVYLSKYDTIGTTNSHVTTQF